MQTLTSHTPLVAMPGRPPPDLYYKLNKTIHVHPASQGKITQWQKLTKNIAPTKNLRAGGWEKVSNGGRNKNNCPPKVT